MNVLLIGYGSIGRRHYDVLSRMSDIGPIDLVTKQVIPDTICYAELTQVPELNRYDYFVIASETAKHYDQLTYIEDTVSDKIILCEKPIVSRLPTPEIRRNHVFVGYVLRFHPLLHELHHLLQGQTILSVNAACGQYLPRWRPGSNYRQSYSAKSENGGGVLLDLSHEIDYVLWLAGPLREIKSFQVKVSDLDIQSDDLTTIMARTLDNGIVNISVDYISKLTHRDIRVETINHTYALDMANNTLTIGNKQGDAEAVDGQPHARNDMFHAMHKDILGSRTIACTYQEGMETMKVIDCVQRQNP